MKTRYILLAIIALAFSACAKNSEPAEPEGVQMTFTAYQEGSEMTRTTVQSGGTQVYWEPSDEIKVFFNGASGRFVSQNTGNASVATFTGTLNVIVGATEGAGYSTQTWGLYPYRADAVLEGNAMVTTLPASQTGRSGSFAKNTNITVAQSNGYGLAFYNVCGGLRFSLTQEGIKRVTFQGNNGEAIAGKIKVAFADGSPVVQEVSESETVITLTAPGGGSFQTGQWYYISAIPGTLSGGYKMVFYKESESAKLTSSSPVTFKRGIFGSLADADEDLMFKPSGSGDDPNPDDNIQFADPIAKYACVEKFDTNGDGEVSYAEAAAATTLSGLFTDWNTVTEFDEIKFFTSVTSTQGVFTGLRQLKHITIPDNITTLGTFQYCAALDTVNLPAALSSLPSCCFEGCAALKSVTLPAGITSIPDYAFNGCRALETLAVPSTITSVGSYAFVNCSALTSIDLPSGLKIIGSDAFRYCNSLVSVTFPTSLTLISARAFSYCSSLTSLTVGNGVHLEYNAFENCTALTSAVLSIGVSGGGYAFLGCSALVSVVLPEDMTAVPVGCFKNCTSLTTITWPTALTTIGEYAFEGCRFEENDYALELPASVTTIGSNAFGLIHHLVLPSTSAISIQSNSFKTDYTFLYVPANMVEMYKVRTNWSKYANRILPISDYPVENPPIGGTVGEAIDLGLSVKWASWNVGATAPEEYGAYFAWGETDVDYWEYDWASYKWCNGSSTTLTKYNTSSSYGIVDNKTTLDPEDDAAHVNWGGAWRLPTPAEWIELKTNCTWTRTTRNGVNGWLVTVSNGNSIFLPAAGRRIDSSLDYAGSYGHYWSSSLYLDTPYRAWHVFFYDYVDWYDYDRYNGCSVRPVCP